MDVATDAADPAEEALRTLADPRRREILRLVTERELAAGEIAESFDVTRSAVSQHLTVLKGAGLLSERREGTRRLYRADPDGLARVRQVVNEMWASSLELAASVAEEPDAAAPAPGRRGRRSAG